MKVQKQQNRLVKTFIEEEDDAYEALLDAYETFKHTKKGRTGQSQSAQAQVENFG